MDDTQEQEWTLVTYKKKKKKQLMSKKEIFEQVLENKESKSYIDEEDEYNKLPEPLHYKCKQYLT